MATGAILQYVQQAFRSASADTVFLLKERTVSVVDQYSIAPTSGESFLRC